MDRNIRLENNMNKTIGDHTYGDIEFTGGTFGHLTIGKYCSIGENVKAFMSQDHNYNNISTYPFGRGGMAFTTLMKHPLPQKQDYNFKRHLSVRIGNDVFIGSNVVIFRGVNIGDGAIIGAYSTITKSVPPYAVVVGNDRHLRYRFSEEDIKFLLELKWWDFDDQRVASIANLLCSDKIDELRKTVHAN